MEIVLSVATPRGRNALPFRGPAVRIGRNPTCQIALTDDEAPGVSWDHAEITLGATAQIRDLGSRNGTFVNDLSITGPVDLEAGDEIRLGANGPTLVVQTLTTVPAASRSNAVPADPHIITLQRRQRWLTLGTATAVCALVVFMSILAIKVNSRRDKDPEVTDALATLAQQQNELIEAISKVDQSTAEGKAQAAAIQTRVELINDSIDEKLRQEAIRRAEQLDENARATARSIDDLNAQLAERKAKSDPAPPAATVVTAELPNMPRFMFQKGDRMEVMLRDGNFRVGHFIDINTDTLRLVVMAGAKEVEQDFALSTVSMVVSPNGAFVYDRERSGMFPAWTHYAYDKPRGVFVRGELSFSGDHGVKRTDPAVIAGEQKLAGCFYLGANGEKCLALLLPDGPKEIAAAAIGSWTTENGEFTYDSTSGDFSFTSTKAVIARNNADALQKADQLDAKAFQRKIALMDALARQAEAITPDSTSSLFAPSVSDNRTLPGPTNVRINDRSNTSNQTVQVNGNNNAVGARNLSRRLDVNRSFFANQTIKDNKGNVIGGPVVRPRTTTNIRR